jgi:hypothetical protein
MIEFDTTLALVVGLVCGIYAGWKAAERFHTAMISDILERAGVTPEKLESMMVDLGKEMGEEVEFPKVEIKIESHSGQLYAFRKDNDQFLAQGVDRETLLKTIAEKLNNVTLVIAEADGAQLVKENPTS